LLKKKGYQIANDGIYLEDILRNFEEKPPNFYCRGGQDVLYLDWLGDVYPCFFRAKLFNILENDKARFLKNVRCNDCFTNCFREPSLIPQISSPRLLLKEIMSHPSGILL